MIEQAIEYSSFLARFHADGARTGLTPHRVVFRQGTAAVRLFVPAEVRTAPLLAVMPLINKWSVFDLTPERSVVARLLQRGVPVYVLDWGAPGPEDAALGMEELLLGLLHRVMDRTRRDARQRFGTEHPLDVLGYCVGGTFLAAYLGLRPDAARRAAFLCAPIDFTEAGRLGVWANPDTFPVDAVVDHLGNFPPELMGQSFLWLKPGNVTAKYRALWDRFSEPGFKETWAAVEAWNGDNVPFWGEAYRSYIRHGYMENRLVEGGWPIGGEIVDLSRCSMPALVLAASDDHICPPAAAFGLKRAWGGPVEEVTLRGGHVGVCLGKTLPDTLADWMARG